MSRYTCDVLGLGLRIGATYPRILIMLQGLLGLYLRKYFLKSKRFKLKEHAT